MTKEQYEQAKDYRHDIGLLDSVIYSQKQNHWVKFVTPDGGNDSGYSDVFLEDFKKWVEKEREKLLKLFEEL